MIWLGKALPMASIVAFPGVGTRLVFVVGAAWCVELAVESPCGILF